MGDSKQVEAPRFLVKYDGKYYLTVGVLEYDPAEARTDPEKRGVAEVARYFEQGTHSAEFRAPRTGDEIEVRAFSSAVAFGQATNNFD